MLANADTGLLRRSDIRPATATCSSSATPRATPAWAIRQPCGGKCHGRERSSVEPRVSVEQYSGNEHLRLRSKWSSKRERPEHFAAQHHEPDDARSLLESHRLPGMPEADGGEDGGDGDVAFALTATSSISPKDGAVRWMSDRINSIDLKTLRQPGSTVPALARPEQPAFASPSAEVRLCGRGAGFGGRFAGFAAGGSGCGVI